MVRAQHTDDVEEEGEEDEEEIVKLEDGADTLLTGARLRGAERFGKSAFSA